MEQILNVDLDIKDIALYLRPFVYSEWRVYGYLESIS
jgi:hypothetical protein